MKTMKKAFLVIVLLALSAVLFACGPTQNGDDDEKIYTWYDRNFFDVFDPSFIVKV